MACPGNSPGTTAVSATVVFVSFAGKKKNEKPVQRLGVWNMLNTIGAFEALVQLNHG
jgi:hypothetical protein